MAHWINNGCHHLFMFELQEVLPSEHKHKWKKIALNKRINGREKNRWEETTSYQKFHELKVKLYTPDLLECGITQVHLN